MPNLVWLPRPAVVDGRPVVLTIRLARSPRLRAMGPVPPGLSLLHHHRAAAPGLVAVEQKGQRHHQNGGEG